MFSPFNLASMCELSRHNEDKNIIDRLQDGTTSERGKSRAVRQEFLYIRLAAVALWDCNFSIHSVNLAPLSFLPSVRPSLFRSPWMSYRNDRKILCNEIIFTFVITVIVLVFTPSVLYPVVLSGFLSAIVTNFSIQNSTTFSLYTLSVYRVTRLSRREITSSSLFLQDLRGNGIVTFLLVTRLKNVLL